MTASSSIVSTASTGTSLNDNASSAPVEIQKEKITMIDPYEQKAVVVEADEQRAEENAEEQRETSNAEQREDNTSTVMGAGTDGAECERMKPEIAKEQEETRRRREAAESAKAKAKAKRIADEEAVAEAQAELIADENTEYTTTAILAVAAVTKTYEQTAAELSRQATIARGVANETVTNAHEMYTTSVESLAKAYNNVAIAYEDMSLTCCNRSVLTSSINSTLSSGATSVRSAETEPTQGIEIAAGEKGKTKITEPKAVTTTSEPTKDNEEQETSEYITEDGVISPTDNAGTADEVENSQDTTTISKIATVTKAYEQTTTELSRQAMRARAAYDASVGMYNTSVESLAKTYDNITTAYVKAGEDLNLAYCNRSELNSSISSKLSSDNEDATNARSVEIEEPNHSIEIASDEEGKTKIIEPDATITTTTTSSSSSNNNKPTEDAKKDEEAKEEEGSQKDSTSHTDNTGSAAEKENAADRTTTAPFIAAMYKSLSKSMMSPKVGEEDVDEDAVVTISRLSEPIRLSRDQTALSAFGEKVGLDSFYKAAGAAELEMINEDEFVEHEEGTKISQKADGAAVLAEAEAKRIEAKGLKAAKEQRREKERQRKAEHRAAAIAEAEENAALKRSLAKQKVKEEKERRAAALAEAEAKRIKAAALEAAKKQRKEREKQRKAKLKRSLVEKKAKEGKERRAAVLTEAETKRTKAKGLKAAKEQRREKERQLKAEHRAAAIAEAEENAALKRSEAKAKRSEAEELKAAKDQRKEEERQQNAELKRSISDKEAKEEELHEDKVEDNNEVRTNNESTKNKKKGFSQLFKHSRPRLGHDRKVQVQTTEELDGNSIESSKAVAAQGNDDHQCNTEVAKIVAAQTEEEKVVTAIDKQNSKSPKTDPQTEEEKIVAIDKQTSASSKTDSLADVLAEIVAPQAEEEKVRTDYLADLLAAYDDDHSTVMINKQYNIIIIAGEGGSQVVEASADKGPEAADQQVDIPQTEVPTKAHVHFLLPPDLLGESKEDDKEQGCTKTTTTRIVGSSNSSKYAKYYALLNANNEQAEGGCNFLICSDQKIDDGSDQKIDDGSLTLSPYDDLSLTNVADRDDHYNGINANTNANTYAGKVQHQVNGPSRLSRNEAALPAIGEEEGVDSFHEEVGEVGEEGSVDSFDEDVECGIFVRDDSCLWLCLSR